MVGAHEGLARYTVGQRRGIGLAAAQPQYVTALDPSSNAVRVGPESALFARTAWFRDFNWLPAGAPSPDGERVEAQIRYRHKPAAATLFAAQGRLEFDEPQRAITPGQSAVFYRGDRLLGGARLSRSVPRSS